MEHVALGAVALFSSLSLAAALRKYEESEETAEQEREPWSQTIQRLHFDQSLMPVGQVVPFRLVKDNPIIPLRLNGDNQVTCWIVDSGYGYTAVDNSVYKRLKLRPKGTVALETLQTDNLISTDLPAGVIMDFASQRPLLESTPHMAVVRQ